MPTGSEKAYHNFNPDGLTPAGSSFRSDKNLIAKPYNSGFRHAHDTYNGMSCASDGKIYYVLCSELIDTAGQMFSYDPGTGKAGIIGDLTEMCGERGMKVVSQGKSHVNFYESDEKLYFATHLGYYSIVDGMEVPGIPERGYKNYRGGHLLEYNMKTKTARSLGIAPNGEGILTMTMDTVRKTIYGLTWPSGYLFRYDAINGKLTGIGNVTGEAEGGRGDNYRVICRSIVTDPRDGTAYFTNAEGDILYVLQGSNRVGILEGDNMRKDYFGIYGASTAGSMAYNWRQVFWHENEQVFWGVHGNSGYLFRFDPSIPSIDLFDRLTSLPSKRSGMFDQFSFGYLGFSPGPGGNTIYYLTGGPVYIKGKRLQGVEKIKRGAAKGIENLHLITYDIPTARYCDHGSIFFTDGSRPLYVNSLAVGEDGTVYTLARITQHGQTRTDLVIIPNPFK